MTERVEELLDRYLDLWLGGAEVEIENFLAEHPELDEVERERLRRLAGLLAKQADGSTCDPEPAPPVLEGIGPYRILRELGRGGQGAVYLAEDTRFARKVALKVVTRHGLELRGDPQRQESFARLKREAEVVSRLDHPGICVVYEMGAERNDLYIAMRFVEGETLAKRIADARAGSEPLTKSDTRRGRPVALPGSDGGPAGPGTPPSTGRSSIERILALMEQSARALHMAHETGVVHRDVKPGNIMVTPEGQPVLLDFGLAHDLEHGTTALTLSGGVLGTPAYMAPEQLSPSRGPIDRRADVYALGVTLYECLTLRRPFEAPTRELLYRLILTEQPSRPGRLNASIPRDLEVVLETAMEKDVAHRYQTALDFAEDLRRVRLREPIGVRPAGAVLRATRWMQRNPVLAMSVGCVFLATAIGLMISLYLWHRERDARRLADGRRWITESRAVLADNPCLALLLAIEGAPQAPGPGANNALLDAIRALREERRIQAQAGLQRAFPSEDGRFVLAISLDETCRVWNADTWQSLAVLSDDAHGFHDAVFSPDGKRLATTGSDGGFRIWDTDRWSIEHISLEPPFQVDLHGFDASGQRLSMTSSATRTAEVFDVEHGTLLHRVGAGDHEISFSPDGKQLLTWSDAGVHVWRVDAASPSWVVDIPNPTPGGRPKAIFSPDGRRVLASFPNGSASLWDVDAPAKLCTLDSIGNDVSALAFRTDGRRVLVAHSEAPACVWNVPEGELVCRLNGPVYSASFSPDGERILAWGGDRTARLWDADTGSELGVFAGHEGSLGGVWFARAGSTVVTASSDGTIREWDLESEGQRTTYHPASGRFVWADFDPTSRRIAAATDQGRVEVVDLASSQGSHAFQLEGTLGVASLSFSPDGRRLVTAAVSWMIPGRPDNAARTWDAETGRPLIAFEHPGNPNVYDAQFSPDGRFVVTAADDHKARIWDSRTGSLVRELVGHTSGVRSAAFGPTGKRVVTCSESLSDSTVRVWDAESGRELAVLSTQGARPIQVAVSPDGRQVLAACWWGTACLWDLPSARLIQKQAHFSHAVSADFSPDGELLLTAGENPSARLWDAASFEEFATLDLHAPSPNLRRPGAINASFSPDGRWVVTVWQDGSVRIWPVDPLQRARELAPRDLTDAERERFGIAANR